MVKTKALISLAVTTKLICVFVFANAKCRFSHEAARIITLVQASSQLGMFESNLVGSHEDRIVS